MTADISRHMHVAYFLLHQFQCRKHRTLGATNAKPGRACRQRCTQGLGHIGAALLQSCKPTGCLSVGKRCQIGFRKCRQACGDGFDVVLTRPWQNVFAVQRCVHTRAAQLGSDILFDVLGRAFFHHQHTTLALAKFNHLRRNQGVGDVQHQNRNIAVAKGIGQTELLQAAHEGVVQTPLHDQTHILVYLASHVFIQTMANNVVPCCWNAFFQFALFMAKGNRWMRQAHVIKLGGFCHQVLGRHRWCSVGFGHKTAAHMASAYAQLQNGRHIGSF